MTEVNRRAATVAALATLRTATRSGRRSSAGYRAGPYVRSETVDKCIGKAGWPAVDAPCPAVACGGGGRCADHSGFAERHTVLPDQAAQDAGRQKDLARPRESAVI